MADNNMNTTRTTEQQRVKEITDKLEAGLMELFESEKYKSYIFLIMILPGIPGQ